MSQPYSMPKYRTTTPLWRWLPAGIFGGISGGFGTAWLLWGPPMLLMRSLCILIKAPLAIAMLALVTTMGCTFAISLQTLLRGIKQLVRPRRLSLYEPYEPIPEMEMFPWPHPGCGLLLVLPILLIAGVVSVPWLWLGPTQVPIGWLILSAVVGLPIGLAIARQEADSSLGNQTPPGVAR